MPNTAPLEAVHDGDYDYPTPEDLAAREHAEHLGDLTNTIDAAARGLELITDLEAGLEAWDNIRDHTAEWNSIPDPGDHREQADLGIPNVLLDALAYRVEDTRLLRAACDSARASLTRLIANCRDDIATSEADFDARTVAW